MTSMVGTLVMLVRSELIFFVDHTILVYVNIKHVSSKFKIKNKSIVDADEMLYNEFINQIITAPSFIYLNIFSSYIVKY